MMTMRESTLRFQTIEKPIFTYMAYMDMNAAMFICIFNNAFFFRVQQKIQNECLNSIEITVAGHSFYDFRLLGRLARQYCRVSFRHICLFNAHRANLCFILKLC